MFYLKNRNKQCLVESTALYGLFWQCIVTHYLLTMQKVQKSLMWMVMNILTMFVPGDQEF